MTRLAFILLTALILAACSQNGAQGGASPGPSGNTTSGRPSGANGTPSGAAQT